jgi:hypothetical protein
MLRASGSIGLVNRYALSGTSYRIHSMYDLTGVDGLAGILLPVTPGMALCPR